MFSRRRWDLFAGLAIHTNSLRYAELERKAGELFEMRRESVSLPPGCVVRESISRFDLLEKAFRILRKKLGRFGCPVALGLPAGDTALRFIDYPPMSPGEARRALELEFKDHFPWSRDEVVLDTVVADAPPTDSGMAVLAAAASLDSVNGLLWTARRAGIPLAALEPVNTAFFRAVTGEHPPKENCLVLNLEPEVHSFILGCHGSGVLFRPILNDLKAETGFESEAALQALAEDIRATLTFAGNRFRGLEVHRLILGGRLSSGERLRRALEKQTEVTLSNASESWRIQGPRCAPGFEAAVGLALREPFTETSTTCFDLRPAEFVERERRRHMFSAVRLTSILLALLLVLSCGGYIALALRELHVLSSKNMKRQEEVAALEARQTALTADISRLREREEKMTKALKAMGQELPVLEVMEALERLCGPEIHLTAVRFAHAAGEDEKEVGTVMMEGESSVPLPALMERLSGEPLFSGVEMLNSALDEAGSSTFSLLLTISPQTLALDGERGGGK